MVMCDVGQGDGMVLAAGDGSAVVVDTGPDPRAMDRCLDDLGVRRISLVVLTHFHADHVNGLPAVLDGRTVGEIETSPLRDPPDRAAAVDAWAREAGVPVTVAAGRGDAPRGRPELDCPRPGDDAGGERRHLGRLRPQQRERGRCCSRATDTGSC